jgi:hypothetical protein
MRKPAMLILFGLLLALFIWGAVEVYLDRRAEEEVERVFERLNLKGKATYGEVDYSLIEVTLEIKEVTVSTPKGPARIKSVKVLRQTENDLEVAFGGIKPAGEDFEREMNSLGIEDPRLNMYIDASISDEERRLKVRKIMIEMPEAFRLEFSLDLENITSDLLRELASYDEENREELQRLSGKIARVRVKGFRIVLRDLGLRERLLEKEARDKNKSKDEVIKEIIESLEESKSGAKSEFEKRLIDSVSEFIRKGGAISLTLSPDSPPELQELIFTLMLSAQTKDMRPFVQRFNVTVKHLGQ